MVDLAVPVHVAPDGVLQFGQDTAVGVEHVQGLAGVDPPAAVDVRVHLVVVVHQPLDRVGDLQFAAPTRVDAVDGFEDVVVEHVDAHQRQVALGIARLFHQTQDAPRLVQLGHPVAFGMIHLGEHHLAVPAAAVKLADQGADAALDHVVAQEHDEAVVAQKVTADLDRVGETQGRVLGNVGDVDAPAPPVAHGLPDLRARVAHHDADLVDAGFLDRLDDAEEHGLVGHRHQLLGLGKGDGAQTSALAAAENETFHGMTFRETARPCRPISCTWLVRLGD